MSHPYDCLARIFSSKVAFLERVCPGTWLRTEEFRALADEEDRSHLRTATHVLYPRGSRSVMHPSSTLRMNGGARPHAHVRPESGSEQMRKQHDAALQVSSSMPAPESALLNADVSQRFGARLRTMRCARDLTQQSMALRFGIDRSFISDVERGRKSVSLVTLEILAIGLGVTLSELLADV